MKALGQALNFYEIAAAIRWIAHPYSSTYISGLSEGLGARDLKDDLETGAGDVLSALPEIATLASKFLAREPLDECVLPTSFFLHETH